MLLSWRYGLFRILNKISITLFPLMMYNMRLFMLRMSSVNILLPIFFSMSTVYMIYLPRLIYISTSLLTVFHPRRVFSRVFSSLCLLLLCFWMMLTSIPWTNFYIIHLRRLFYLEYLLLFSFFSFVCLLLCDE